MNDQPTDNPTDRPTDQQIDIRGDRGVTPPIGKLEIVDDYCL